MSGLIEDSRWYLRARVDLGMVVDGIRTRDGDGRPCEVVAPRWWDFRRWWTWWFETDGHVEMTLPSTDGLGKRVFKFYVFRSKTVIIPRPTGITLPGGKRIVARPPPRFNP